MARTKDNPGARVLTPSDAEILAGIANKSVAALSELYSRYASRLFGLCVKILKDETAAEDVVQELFVYLWENADRFERQRGQAIAWLMVLCRNRCIDRLRATARQQKRSVRINEGVLQIPSARVLDDPLEHASHREAEEKITQALAKLPKEQRHVIELSYFAGMSQSEIAEQLDIALGTIKTRMRLGMQKLRNLMIEKP